MIDLINIYGGSILAKFQPDIYSRLKSIWSISLLSLIILPSFQAQYKVSIATMKQAPWVNAPFRMSKAMAMDG